MSEERNLSAKYDVCVQDLDLSQMVGFQVRLFSKQFPAKDLYVRIGAAVGRRLVAESTQRNDIIDNLVNHQTVVLQFQYRGEDISVRAKIQKSNGGRCAFDLEDKATPLSQRRFLRVNLKHKVNLAPFPSSGVLGRKLDKLRWMETDLVNFSAGGALLTVPTILNDTVRLIVNVQVSEFEFPQLLLAKVCHGYQYDEFNCRAGIEFVTRERAERMLSPFQMAEMPPVLFSYSGQRRDGLNRDIQQLDAKFNRSANTGVDHEDR